MRDQQGRKLPASHGAYRGVLLAVLVAGLFLFGAFVVFPLATAVAEVLRGAIEGIHDGYEWSPF